MTKDEIIEITRTRCRKEYINRYNSCFIAKSVPDKKLKVKVLGKSLYRNDIVYPAQARGYGYIHLIYTFDYGNPEIFLTNDKGEYESGCYAPQDLILLKKPKQLELF